MGLKTAKMEHNSFGGGGEPDKVSAPGKAGELIASAAFLLGSGWARGTVSGLQALPQSSTVALKK